MPHDMRKSPRRNLKQTAGCLLKGTYHVVGLSQLGEGGCMLESDLVFTEGAEIVVTIQVPKGVIFSCRAQILYLKKGRGFIQYGCQFSQLDLGIKRSIRAFVASKTEEEAQQDLSVRPIH